MAISKAQQKAVAKYMKENYDEIKIRLPKGKKKAIVEHAKKHDESLNAYIGGAIERRMRDEEVAAKEG